MATRVAGSTPIFKKRSANILYGQIFLGLSIMLAAFVFNSKPSAEKAQVTVSPVVSEFDLVSVSVPSEPISAGTRVKDIAFKRVSFPKHQLPENSIETPEHYADYVVVSALPANLPLFKENLSQTGYVRNPVMEKIPLGMRAMTIKVDATSAVEGWAGSGSVVDILLIEKDRTTVVAEKVRILSAERSVAPVEGQSAPTVPSTVTLLVTQEQCLAINTAIPLGKIAFALRSSKDEESWQDTEFKSEELLNKQILTPDNSGGIKGVLSIKGQDQSKSFALTDGRWIKTEEVPKGFFVNADKSK